MAGALVFVFFLLASVGLTLLVYLLIRSETRDLPRMDRRDAERVARDSWEETGRATHDDEE